MRKSILAVALALFVSGLAGAASPSEFRIKAPQPFTVGGTAMPAGLYYIGLVSPAGILEITNAATHATQVQTRVRSAAQQPFSFASSNAAPIADQSSGKTAAIEQATTAAAEPTSSSASVPPDTTRVTLDVKPIDAKVHYLGRLQPGPPFEFDIAKGQRIAVELVRFGFATRRVVIDDKKPVISVGMVPDHYRPKAK